MRKHFACAKTKAQISFAVTAKLISAFVFPTPMAEAIRTTVVPITQLIRTTVVPISGVIGPTVVRIASATGIGYRHDGCMKFSNKLSYAFNYYAIK